MKLSGRISMVLAKKLGPWLLAFLILILLVTRVPLSALRAAFARGPAAVLISYVFFQVLLTLVADSLATRAALSYLGLKFGFLDTLGMRGTSYLLGLINYGLGQTGIAYHLSRRGVASMSAIAAVLFTTVTTLFAFIVATVIGSAFVSGGATRTYARTAILLSLVGVFVYIVVLKVVSHRYGHSSLSVSLLAVGVSGHVWATAARLPHVLVLIAGHWGAMYLWGIVVPFVEGFGLIALTLLIATLPISPNGLGTTQAAQVLFFSRYVNSPVADDRVAMILAFSLFYYTCGVVAQSAVGFACFALSKKWNRD